MQIYTGPNIVCSYCGEEKTCVMLEDMTLACPQCIAEHVRETEYPGPFLVK